MRKVILTNLDDPDNLVDVFDADRITPDGDLHQVAAGVTREEAACVWKIYEEGISERSAGYIKPRHRSGNSI